MKIENLMKSDEMKIITLDLSNKLTLADAHNLLEAIWFDKKTKDFDTDWEKVPVDARVLMKGAFDRVWKGRHFAKYENGRVYVYGSGQTSLTYNNRYKLETSDCVILSTNQAPIQSTYTPIGSEVDWEKVPVDTKVLCRANYPEAKWFYAYFEHYNKKRDEIWVYKDGATSWSAERSPFRSCLTAWEYTKLADE